MNREAATPISKYLASIDRRHNLGTGTGRTPAPNDSLAINLNFNDTYFTEEPSLLQVPGTRSSNSSILSDFGSACGPDRKRKKTLYEDDSEKLQKECDDLERLLRQTQVDLIDARSVISTLEHQKSSAEAQYKQKLISLENQSADLKAEWKEAVEKSKHLEEKATILENKEKFSSDSLHELKVAHSNMVCSLQNRILKLQTDNCELKQKLDEDTSRSSEEIRKLSNDLGGTERGAEKWIMECQTFKDQLGLVQTQLKKCQEDLKESQLQLLKSEELRATSNRVEGDGNQSEITEAAVKRYENLYVVEQLKAKKLAAELNKVRQDNGILRSTMSSELLLQEKIDSLEKTVSYMTRELKEKVQTDEKLKALSREVESWKKVAADLDSSCKTPVNMEAVLRKLQNQVLEYKHDNSDLKFEVKKKGDCLEKIQGENVTLREQQKLLKEQNDKNSVELKKAAKRLILIVKDRDSLKDLKESYEQEFEGRCEKALLERNQHLEKLLSHYETLVNDTSAKRACEKCDDSLLKIEALTSQLEHMRKDQKAISLEGNQSQPVKKLGNVDLDLSYKIISFGKNPSAMSIEEKLKEVLGENEKLKSKLQSMDTSRIDSASVNTEVLQEKLKTLERKHEMLTSAYDYETTQLQTAIERLFGFHVILVREPQSQIRLQSINSPNPDDMFIFQASEEDWMLLETPVLDLFRPEIETYLLTAGNIPGFLAMVTVRYSQGLSDSLEQTSSKEAPAAKSVGENQFNNDEEEDEGEAEENDDDDHSEEEGELEEEVEEEGTENEHSGEDYSEDDGSDDEPPPDNRRRPTNPPNNDYDDDDDDNEIIMLD